LKQSIAYWEPPYQLKHSEAVKKSVYSNAKLFLKVKKIYKMDSGSKSSFFTSY